MAKLTSMGATSYELVGVDELNSEREREREREIYITGSKEPELWEVKLGQ